MFTRETLAQLIFLAGCGQLSVLCASALVPQQLKWKETFAQLPRLHRQMYWVYGGYVVLAIVAQGLVCIACSMELASGTVLSRAVCAYIAVFWGIRLSLQPILDVQAFLTRWWLRAGYHLLTLLFITFTVIFTLAGCDWVKPA